MPVACRVAVLMCVVGLDSWAGSSMVPGAWSVSCADYRSFGFIVGVLFLVVFLAKRRCQAFSVKHTSQAIES